MASSLIRETAPKDGFLPSLLPQHENANGDYVATGENNPLPVLIQLVKGMLPIQSQGQLIDLDVTHTNVSISPNSWSTPTTFKETNGSKFLAIHLQNDVSSTSIEPEVACSTDGVNQDGKTS